MRSCVRAQCAEILQQIEEILSEFEPISLAEMEGVKLMNRVDTKYVTTRGRLSQILAQAKEQYFVQEINGARIAAYDTLYFDTPSLEMYRHHHDRRLVRQKVRIRKYLGSLSAVFAGETLTFLEIKNKNNKGRTKKKRIEVPDQDVLAKPSDEVSDFMNKRCWYDWLTLLPQLRTSFRRITLVNKSKTERLTIDMGLVWDNQQTNVRRTYDDLVIIELKRDGNSPSPMVGIMLDLRIFPLKISKYCVGTALTNPSSKTNRFKVKIRKIEKILSFDKNR